MAETIGSSGRHFAGTRQRKWRILHWHDGNRKGYAQCVNGEQLETFRHLLEAEADLVEGMADSQAEGLETLRERFVHEEFLRMVQAKREGMDQLAKSREAMRPLTAAWIQARNNAGFSDPEVESSLERLRSAFDRVRSAEDEIEAMATAYLARVAGETGSVEERIRLHRSWT